VHKQYQRFDPFISIREFKYTGTLRACYPEIPVPRRSLPSHIVLPDHAETGIPLAERKIRFLNKIDILTPAEIEGMRKVCKVIPLSPQYSELSGRLADGSVV
jgi:methionyl aminopeptidase